MGAPRVEPPVRHYATRAASPAGSEQVRGPRVAPPIVRPLQQRAIGAKFSWASPVLLWCVPGILCVNECWRFFGAKLDHSNPFKPMPSILAYRVPCSEPGPVHSYALAGRQHGFRDDGRPLRARRSTFHPGVTRAARGDAVILDQAHLHNFCRWNHASVARQRPPQPALCSRPSCSPAHWSSRSLSSLSRCCTPPWRPLRAQGRHSQASPGRGPSSGAGSATRPKISAPAAG